MKTILSPEWELSTANPASRDGRPVLVNRSTWQAFGPGDQVRLYPSQNYERAADAVARLVETAKPTVGGDTLVARFLGKLSHR
ncbi:MAG: hypothetical protein H6Q87_20 [candidate division NC10 bacterium]|jgi:superfamily I DNA/RNA helicase|nr:hypothetical protein [candidate division NC10 bacterium]